MSEWVESQVTAQLEASLAQARTNIRILTVLYVVLAIGVVVYGWGRRHGYFLSVPVFFPPSGQAAMAPSAAQPPPTIVAIVNGEPISRDTVDVALDEEGGARITDRLVRETEIIQEAARQKIALDDPDSLLRLSELHREPIDMRTMAVREHTLRAHMLLRKLVLKDVPEARIRRIYDLFHDNLVQYEVYAIVVSHSSEAAKVASDLKTQPFEAVANSRIKPPSPRNGGRVGFMTQSDIASNFGGIAARAVYRRVFEGESLDRPISTGYGLVFLKLGKTRSTYTALKPFIEDMIADAGRAQLIYRLSTSAKVTYPIHEHNAAAAAPAVPVASVSEAPVFVAPPPAASEKPGHNIFALPSTAKSGKSIFAAPLPSAIKGPSSVFAPPPNPK